MISPSYQFVLTTLMVVLTKDIVIAETAIELMAAAE